MRCSRVRAGRARTRDSARAGTAPPSPSCARGRARHGPARAPACRPGRNPRIAASADRNRKNVRSAPWNWASCDSTILRFELARILGPRRPDGRYLIPGRVIQPFSRCHIQLMSCFSRLQPGLGRGMLEFAHSPPGRGDGPTKMAEFVCKVGDTSGRVFQQVETAQSEAKRGRSSPSAAFTSSRSVTISIFWRS